MNVSTFTDEKLLGEEMSSHNGIILSLIVRLEGATVQKRLHERREADGKLHVYAGVHAWACPKPNWCSEIKIMHKSKLGTRAFGTWRYITISPMTQL